MASGKSTIGRLLAEKLGWQFFDTDQWIEIKEDKSIVQIFKTLGESRFRELESSVLQSLAVNSNPAVIATGGGLPCFFENMSIINSTGISIFLNVQPSIIMNRLEMDPSSRPLLKVFSAKEDLLNFITEHLHSRMGYYSNATFTVDGNGEADTVTDTILDIIKAPEVIVQ